MWWIRCEKQMVWNVWIAVLTAPWPFVLSYQYPHRASLHHCTTQWVERQGQDCCHAPFDWLWLGFSAQPHPKGLAGKQEAGPETAHIIPASISNRPTKLDPSEGRICCLCSGWCLSVDEKENATLILQLKPDLTIQTLNISDTKMVLGLEKAQKIPTEKLKHTFGKVDQPLFQ